MSLVTVQRNSTDQINSLVEPVKISATMKSFFEPTPQTFTNTPVDSVGRIKQIDFEKEFNFQLLKGIYDESLTTAATVLSNQINRPSVKSLKSASVKTNRQLFEKYFVVKDAALILPRRSKTINSTTDLNDNKPQLLQSSTFNVTNNLSSSSSSLLLLTQCTDSSSIDNKSLDRCHQHLEQKQEQLEATSTAAKSNNNDDMHTLNNKVIISDELEQSGDILIHLKSMVQLLRPTDTISVAVKLCSYYQNRARYLVVVETPSSRSYPEPMCEESAILGVDLELDQAEIPQCSVGLVIPIYGNCEISLSGDGGFKFKTHQSTHIFKPVSIQAMWSAYQYLHKVLENSRKFNFYSVVPREELADPTAVQLINHEWVKHYTAAVYRTKIDQQNEWYQNEDRSSQREEFTTPYFDQACLSKEQEETGAKIKEKLKEIMISSKDDYGSMSSIHIRGILERELQLNLDSYKKFVDVTIFQFYNQLVECASQVLPYLYLGTEWNASNYDSLFSDGITHVLNVSSDVDNFFPDAFTYLNIRVRDVDETDLLKEFDRTNKFIQEAKDAGSCCLVHCKMGVSRSASVVLAYVMKEYEYSLEEAYDFVKQKRTCINPNEGFRVQLATYESILNAHRAKYSLFEAPVVGVESASSSPEQNESEKCIASAFSVKEAVNKIKSLSSICIDLPSPPSANVNHNHDVKRQKSCPSQLSMRTSKTTSLKKLKEFQSTDEMLINDDTPIDSLLPSSKSARLSLNLNNNENTYAIQPAVEVFVPIGIVKRQVESINFKLSNINSGLVNVEESESIETSRKSVFNPMGRESLTLNNIENSLVDIKMDFKMLFNELSKSNTSKQPQQQTIMCSPDSKRFKMNKNNSI